MPGPVSTKAPADAQAPATGLGVRGISLAYHPSHPVIEDLSTAITPGAVTMIVGPNACGKSTLLRAMSRVLSPGAGQVVLDGRDIATLAPKKLARRVGMLAQSSIAPPGITVHELVARGRYPYQSLLRQWSANDDAAVTEAMERTDVVGQVDLLELCRDLNAELGTTIVAVLHDLNQACRYGDEVIAMRAGSILAHGRPEDVVTAETVEEVFGLAVQVITDPLTGTPLVLPLPRKPRDTASAGEAG